MPYDVPYAGSDADDEYERSGIACPTLPINYESLTSTTDSDTPSNEDTPTTFAHSRTAHASPRGIITTWSPGDCADYLASIGLEQYRAAMIGMPRDFFAVSPRRTQGLTVTGGQTSASTEKLS